MSGGSLDYIYTRINDAAKEVKICARTPLERAFATHLFTIADAMQALEWSLSGDYAEDAADEMMRACMSKGAVLEHLIAKAQSLTFDIQEEVKKLKEQDHASE